MKPLDYQWQRARGVALLVIGRKAQALQVFDEMARQWPDDVYVLASRANLLTEAGDAPKALQDSRRLVSLRHDHGGTWFNHGYMLEVAGLFEEAESAFRRATELSPGLDRAWYGLGLVLIRLQRYDDAMAALKKNTELQPMSPYGGISSPVSTSTAASQKRQSRSSAISRDSSPRWRSSSSARPA